MTEQDQFQEPQQIANPYANLTPKADTSSLGLPPHFQLGLGLAVASFVLGLLSLPLALLVAGAVTGLVGSILAIVHLGRKLPFRAMAVWGLILSVMGAAAGTGFGMLYGISIYRARSTMQEWEDSEFAEHADYIDTNSPDMTLTDLEGNKIILSQLKGKRIVLDFWATWCPPCKKEIPHFIRLRGTTDPNQLVIIGISDESAELIKDFADKHKMNYPLVSASGQQLPEPYSNIRSIPTTFFIDRQGVIQNVLTGYHSFEELKDNALRSKEDTNEPKKDAPGGR